MNFSDVSDFIGTADDAQIDAIYQLCRHRQHALHATAAMAALAELKPGDRVRIKHGIRPQYLVGVTGIVEPSAAKRPDSLSVRLDYSVRKFSSAWPIGIPASCLEKVS